MSVLEKINASSRERAHKIKLPQREPAPTAQSFLEALRRKTALPQLIAELKRRSPSHGILKEKCTVEDTVRIYEPYAAALSILTEPEHFHGSITDLVDARALTELPLLCKDFILTEAQIIEARHAGADSFLLIVASLAQDELEAFIERGRSLGMEPLVEALTEEDLDRALSLGAKIVGINNRNLHTLEIDLTRAESLAKKIPARVREKLVLVAESGYSNRDELLRLPHYFDAVLMGSTLMQASNGAQKIHEIFG